MGHATANDLLTKFIDVIKNLDGGSHNKIQISMDRPSTNWKFLEMLQEDYTEKEQHELINNALCSLHIIHYGWRTQLFQTG